MTRKKGQGRPKKTRRKHGQHEFKEVISQDLIGNPDEIWGILLASIGEECEGTLEKLMEKAKSGKPSRDRRLRHEVDHG